MLTLESNEAEMQRLEREQMEHRARNAEILRSQQLAAEILLHTPGAQLVEHVELWTQHGLSRHRTTIEVLA
jgi:hypothetical protein